MGRTKVFVGNLSFKTNDRDLAKEFEVAGKVVTASIISRGSRSLGYGFVEMDSEEDAKKSVELLNKKLIDGREINVEIARPREEKPAQDQNNAPESPNGGAPAGEGNQRGGGAGRGRRPFRGRRFRRGGPRNQGNGAPPAEGGAQGAPAQAQAGAQGAPAQGSPAQGGAQGAGERRPRAPRAPRAPRNDTERAPRNPSNDTLFVANLPFSIDDAGLSKIFEGLNIKSAHVVRKHNERSKGFGFVEFHNPEDQQKALSATDKKQVDGRELSVKVALTEVARNGAGAPGSPATPAANAGSEQQQQ